MRLSFTEIFKYSDILNPVSPTMLLKAGQLPGLKPGKTILDQRALGHTPRWLKVRINQRKDGE